MMSESTGRTRPAAICCPECGRIIELIEKAGNYPCERCGVLWRWYQRGGSNELVELKREEVTQ